jgi:hypothetical protein
MSVRRLLAVLSGAFATGCAVETVAVPFADACNALTSDSVTFFIARDADSSSLTWTSAGISRSAVSLVPRPEATNRYQDGRRFTAADLPGVLKRSPDGNYWGVPFSSSPDGQFALATAYPAPDRLQSYVPTEVVLVDANGRTLARLHVTQAQHGLRWIESYVWAPSSKMVVVIEVQQTESKGSLKALVSPHPVLEREITAKLYDTSLNQLCSATLINGALGGKISAAWN